MDKAFSIDITGGNTAVQTRMRRNDIINHCFFVLDSAFRLSSSATLTSKIFELKMFKKLGNPGLSQVIILNTV
jgi:hypothetical protein